jgi:predicted nucleic acid-binding protein
MANIPKDTKLYESIKNKVYKQITKHSAYRSGILVKEYKKAYLKKYKSDEAYYGKKTNKQGLARWFKEEWKNQRGEVGYKNTNDVYRPTRRVTPKTPLTFNELTKYELAKAKKIKEIKGRVYRFRNKK